ncbi:primosomal protein N' [Methylomonas paludis]|uniref:Replication restart protein PriA n=1 Tax=Methylomonas paludis TaxID=1173101 RepID=A0A975R9D1_9GAMM|nr:primosomal protein N' [Methylomonas paludis]QWF70952.1 primosomal protein N' [Methylomonas paludis]
MANCSAAAERCFFQVAIAIPLDRLFDYLPPSDYLAETVKPGVRVLVPFGKGRKVGLLMAICSDSAVDNTRLKAVEQILDDEPILSGPDICFLQWISHYYHYPLGEVLANALPTALRQGKPARLDSQTSYVLSELGSVTPMEQLKRAPKQQALLNLFHNHGGAISSTALSAFKPALQTLLAKGFLQPISTVPINDNPGTGTHLIANPEQQIAINTISAALGHFSVFLLEGVTGSGKTEVYMQVISAALAKGLQVLVLLPEISLTPQLELRFRQRFSAPIVTFHSKLSDKQRLGAWLSIQRGTANIMLGTRSAFFTPLAKPGLIILDEEHDTSFKQQEGLRFSARDAAIARGKHLGIPVLLGSATPSLESLFNVGRQRYQLLPLSTRAGNASEPVLQLLDIRNKKMQSGLSEQLLALIQDTLAQNQQVLLFINRRGYAPVQICHGCGWVARCRYCDANMVIHAAERRLRCHHCGSEQPLTPLCPACNTGELQALGMGTERIEQTLTQVFADKKLVRLDKDTTKRKGALEDYLQCIRDGDADIILGTQMLAKGHHFPNVTLVAILDIDSSLFSIDYRAEEKLAQLIIQVAGRAGRADMPGRVILQTRHPQHPLLLTLLNRGYRAYAQAALAERIQAQLPPYTHQALFRAEANNITAPQLFLTALSGLINRHNSQGISVFGPVSAPMARRAGQFRFQLLLQSRSRKDLHQVLDQILAGLGELKEARSIKWSLDVDPVDLY